MSAPENKPPISGPSNADPGELVRRYRATGIRSDRRRSKETRWKGSRHQGKRPSGIAPTSQSEQQTRSRLSHEERRRREKLRGRRRNRRIMGRRTLSFVRHVAVNLGYLIVAGVIAWVLLRSMSGSD